MAIINATRMELLKTKKRLGLARRGHKLLKDKLDGLIQKYLEFIKEYQGFRESITDELLKFYQLSILANASSSQTNDFEFLPLTGAKARLENKTATIMGIKISKYSLTITGNPFNFSSYFISTETYKAVAEAHRLLPLMVNLAELEQALDKIGQQIIETRHRVNALEYKLIPELNETARFIVMKLSEMERSYQTTLMKMKDIIRKH
jgi:V/A-type H+/Na+-transporting ATPase subunit D